jgi:hypothetical protein
MADGWTILASLLNNLLISWFSDSVAYTFEILPESKDKESIRVLRGEYFRG